MKRKIEKQIYLYLFYFMIIHIIDIIINNCHILFLFLFFEHYLFSI